MPDYEYYPDVGGTVLILEPEHLDYVQEVQAQVLLSAGIQGPPGPPGPVGPMGPPNTTPISVVAGNGLVIGSDGGLYVPPQSWASTNW